MEGPPGFPHNDTVACDFVEPRANSVPARGTTPKFFCVLRHGPNEGEVVKVKFGRSNGEVYGEVLASHLLWALGVAVDWDYPVRVRCHHCPEDPWVAYRDFPRVDSSPRAVREFDDAIVQRLYPGAVMQEHPDQGWSFDELGHRAELDALRLLAAFIAHGDDKPENQRMVCPFEAIDAHEHCKDPRLLIADLGSTFGRGASSFGVVIDAESRPTFAAWSTLPVWEDRATCRVHWATRSAHSNPAIAEEGRKLLAARLAALTTEQIRALFVVARIERRGETLNEGVTQRPVTVDDWRLAFERRRAEIVEARCP